MYVTLGGIVTLVKPLQPENAWLPMYVMLDGIVTLVKPLQPENAKSPMDVTGNPPNVLGMESAPVGAASVVACETARWKVCPVVMVASPFATV